MLKLNRFLHKKKGYLIYETVLVLLVSKELFPFLYLEPQNSAYTINISLDE